MVIPVILYFVSLGLLYLTSMQGFYLVGSDIHSEYYIASRMYDAWDINYPHLYNASVSTTLIAPWISRFLSIDLVTVFKVIYPALFAVVPVILYFIYRTQTDDKRALFAALFFISVPVFFMEMPQLPRQELAELFLCIMLLFIVSNIRYKSVAIVPLATIIVTLHFSMGIVAIAFLSGMLAVKLANEKLQWRLIETSKVSYTCLIITLTLAITTATVWGLNIADGMALHSLTNIFSVGHEPVVTSNTVATSDMVTAPFAMPVAKSDGIITAALGLDIMNSNVTAWGKIFRVIQWITQLLVVLGCFQLLFRYRQYKFSSEFISGIAASCVLLLMCITVFGFSGLLGMTRFYHISLIFLAPMFVLGADFICSIKINNMRRNLPHGNKTKTEPVSL